MKPTTATKPLPASGAEPGSEEDLHFQLAEARKNYEGSLKRYLELEKQKTAGQIPDALGLADLKKRIARWGAKTETLEEALRIIRQRQNPKA